MSKYTDRAVELFKSGFNCSQAVFAEFSEKIALDEQTRLRVSECSGVSVVYGATDGEDREAKKKTYEVVQEIAAEFKKENPSIVCRELLGLSKADENPTPEARTEQYYKKRPCVQLVADAAAAAEKILFANEQEETK